MNTWSAPVRYAEVDQQGVVFNSHYLLWCDEAMSAFCRARELTGFAERVHLVTSTITWRAPARWGDTIDVDVRCLRVGRSSATLQFELRVATATCADVETVYVLTDADSRPVAIPEDTRRALLT